MKLTSEFVGDGHYDIQENVDNAAKNIMNHINEFGSINISLYNDACRHYKCNRETVFVYTHPYNKWCMDCGIITTYENWNEAEYRCRTCAVKHKEKMRGFVMQKYWEGTSKIPVNEILHAIKYASNYEADLYVDGKLAMSPLGLEHEDNAEKLARYGIVQYYRDNRLRWKYADESINVLKYYVTYYEYQIEGKKKVGVSVHDYPAHKDHLVFDTKEEVTEYFNLLYSVSGETIEMTYWIDGDYTSETLVFNKPA